VPRAVDVGKLLTAAALPQFRFGVRLAFRPPFPHIPGEPRPPGSGTFARATAPVRSRLAGPAGVRVRPPGHGRGAAVRLVVVLVGQVPDQLAHLGVAQPGHVLGDPHPAEGDPGRQGRGGPLRPGAVPDGGHLEPQEQPGGGHPHPRLARPQLPPQDEHGLGERLLGHRPAGPPVRPAVLALVVPGERLEVVGRPAEPLPGRLPGRAGGLQLGEPGEPRERVGGRGIGGHDRPDGSECRGRWRRRCERTNMGMRNGGCQPVAGGRPVPRARALA
jgi:hypothetical protein